MDLRKDFLFISIFNPGFKDSLMIGRYFDSNDNKIVDLIVIYYPKNYNHKTKKYEINFNRMPLFVIKHHKEYENILDGYIFNDKEKTYYRIPMTYFLNRED